MKSLAIVLLCLVVMATAEIIPVFFDARFHWKDCIESPRSQGKCTSSWAHAFAGMVSDRLCVDNKAKVSLSAQTLISCSNHSKTCDGTFDQHEVEDLLVNTGMVTNSCLHYEENNLIECPVKCQNEEEIQWYKCKEIVHLNDEDSIKLEILKHGPVVCIGNIHADFKDYYSGIYYRATAKKEPVKEVFKVIGWGWENGIFYWTVETARGDQFGENGFARVRLIKGAVGQGVCASAIACRLD